MDVLDLKVVTRYRDDVRKDGHTRQTRQDGRGRVRTQTAQWITLP